MGFVDLHGFCFFFFLVSSGVDALNLKALLICTGVISLQFQTSILHGFEKNVLVVSSVLTLDSETGNMLTTSRVQPKKPSKALFMQSLDGQDPNAPDLSKWNSLEDAIPKQLVLLCSEKAVYVYSFNTHHSGS